MTEIAFHFNAPDRLAYVCRLLRKAVAAGAQLVVVGPPDQLDRLDSDLWTFSASDFVPHCRAQAEPEVLSASPVVLAADTDEVRLNLRQVEDGSASVTHHFWWLMKQQSRNSPKAG